MIHGMLAVLLATTLATLAPSLVAAADDGEIRRELEKLYQERAEAFGLQDHKARVTLYTEHFHAIHPDGEIVDVRAEKAMDMNTPVEARYTIRQLAVSENRLIAVAEVFREMKWMSKLTGRIRTISTSEMARHRWSKTAKGWRLKSVDHMRDRKRFVGGRRVNPAKPFDPNAPPYEPPTEEGASAAIPSEGATGTETIDSLLAHTLVTHLEAKAAMYNTSNQLRTPNGLAQGVPPYLEASAKGIAGDMEKLKAVRSDDPHREVVRKRQVERLESMGEAVGLLIQAMRAAGVVNGWNPEANDLWSKAWEFYAAGPLVDSLEMGVFSGSSTIRNALPRDALTFAGIARDSCGYELGAMAWVSAPMRLAFVRKDSYAEQLGLQAGDEIMSIGGRRFESMAELKWGLAALAGKKVDIVVERDGRQIRLHHKVPRFPASDVQVHRELDQQYQKLVAVHAQQDPKAIASMLTSDFDAILSDGKIIDVRAMGGWQEMERNTARYAIRNVVVSANRLIAVAEVASNSEVTLHTWSRTEKGWKLKSVEHIRPAEKVKD